MVKYTEDNLVQQTTADYLRDSLGWESVFAYNNETFGPDGMLGRLSDKEVVLTRYLTEKLVGSIRDSLKRPIGRFAANRTI